MKIRKTPNSAGISQANILKEYLAVLDKELPHLTPESALFWRGEPPTPTTKSYFMNSPVGEGMLRAVSMEMAQFLQIPNFMDYTSHTFRHTAASFVAENGATVAQLTVCCDFVKTYFR